MNASAFRGREAETGMSVLTFRPTDSKHPTPPVCNAPARFLSVKPFRRPKGNLKAQNPRFSDPFLKRLSFFTYLMTSVNGNRRRQFSSQHEG